MDHHRVLLVEGIPSIYQKMSARLWIISRIPSSSLFFPQFLQLHGTGRSVLPVQEIVWSTLLSFIAFKRKHSQPTADAQPVAPRFRVIYLCSGFGAVRLHIDLLKRLRERIVVPDFENVRVTAFGDPANMSINRRVQARNKNFSNQEKNAACRATVRTRRCRFYNNVSDDTVQKPDIPPFICDLDDFCTKLDKSNVCPYFFALSRMESADLIITTYDALKGTLSGQRLPQERLLLDQDTCLICDDAFAMEKAFEECYDFTLSVPILHRTMALCVERRRWLWQMQKALKVGPAVEKEAFYALLHSFCRILDKVSRVLTGEIPFAPETPEGRVKLLSDLGLRRMSPKSTMSIMTLLQTDVFDVKTFHKPLQRSTLIQDLTNVQQFFMNLADSDVAGWMFSAESAAASSPFRFWLDRPDGVADPDLDHATLNFKFFGVSVNPVLAALRRRGLGSLLTFGPMVPLSLASIDRSVAFRISRLPYVQMLRPNLSRNLFSGIFAFGPADVAFNCDTTQREQTRYILALGRAIRRILDAMSDIQALILFPSMTYYESCAAVWAADETLRHFRDCLQVAGNCGGQGCSQCAGNMECCQRHAQFTVTLARGAALDGAGAGYQAVLVVALPYPFLLDPRITAKRAYLKAFRDAAFSFYAQEAVNATVAPFVRTSCLDAASVYRGRMFIVLDSRMQRNVKFLPQSLQQTIQEYTTFDEGLTHLQTFLRNIPPWDISQGGDLIDPAVMAHVRQLHTSFQSETVSKIDMVNGIAELLERFRADGNIDLLAAGIVDTVQLEEQYEGSEFSRHLLPWLVNFRRFFRKSDLQRYWPVVVENILKQIGERIAQSEPDSRLTFTLPADVTSPHERCHVQ